VRSSICILLLVIMVSACQSSIHAASFDAQSLDLPPPAASAIAGDMVSRFAEQTPGTSKRVIVPPDGSAFGAALTDALKGWGYMITADAKTEPKPIELAYGVDRVDGQVLAHLQTSTVGLSRGYSVTSGGARPATPLSVEHRN
jgi:type IV secretion system protein TrbH